MHEKHECTQFCLKYFSSLVTSTVARVIPEKVQPPPCPLFCVLPGSAPLSTTILQIVTVRLLKR